MQILLGLMLNDLGNCELGIKGSVLQYFRPNCSYQSFPSGEIQSVQSLQFGLHDMPTWAP